MGDVPVTGAELADAEAECDAECEDDAACEDDAEWEAELIASDALVVTEMTECTLARLDRMELERELTGGALCLAQDQCNEEKQNKQSLQHRVWESGRTACGRGRKL